MKITIETLVNTSVEKIWEAWTKPEHVMQWNHASDDWHCPKATNDFRVGGKFSYTMASRDGKMSFDFEGIYTVVVLHKKISYRLGDERVVDVFFEKTRDIVKVVETFDAENIHSVEQQKNGWQAILNNFKMYSEKI